MNVLQHLRARPFYRPVCLGPADVCLAALFRTSTSSICHRHVARCQKMVWAALFMYYFLWTALLTLPPLLNAWLPLSSPEIHDRPAEADGGLPEQSHQQQGAQGQARREGPEELGSLKIRCRSAGVRPARRR